MGHKKFHNSEESSFSPKKIARNNQLIELKNENEFKNRNNDKSEYILTSNSNKGDSGHFLELCYNKFNKKTIFKLLISLKNKGKLINRPDLFINLNDCLEKYVILKKIAEEKQISLQLNGNMSMSIEDEINYMEQIIDIKKYLEEKEKSINKSSKKQCGKKSPQEKKNYFFKSFKKDKNEESFEEKEEDNNENDEEEEEKEKIEKKKIQRILKKFNFKYDEELPFNVEKKLGEKDLSQEDYKDLNYLYLKFVKLY
jgi:hypothetical protein